MVIEDTPTISCIACKGQAWKIHPTMISCCRCGISYFVPDLTSMPVQLVKETIPSVEVLSALEILDGPEK